MNALTTDQAVGWCAERRIEANARGQLRYLDQQYRCIEAPLPKEAGRMLALGYSLLMSTARGDSEEAFEGALLWVTETGVSSPTFGRIGRYVFERMPAKDSAFGSLGTRPARLAGPRELVEMQTMLFQAMAIGWDVYLVPASGSHTVLVSHDEVVRIQSPDVQVFERLFARMEAGNWSPRERVCAEDGKLE